jgi:hypothetical protein
LEVTVVLVVRVLLWRRLLQPDVSRNRTSMASV